MMKTFSFLAAGLLALGLARPHAATAQNAPSWALALSSPDATRITRVATDANNYTVVAGYLTGPAALGPQALAVGGPGLTNGFAARLDPQGAVQWVRYLAATGSGLETLVSGLALDAAGNAVVCGAYRNGSLPLGAFTLPVHATNAALSNGLAAKLDPAGNVLWAQSLTDPGASSATAAAVDAAGTAYVAVSTNAAPLVGGLGIRTFSAAGVPGPGHDFPGVTGVPATSPFGVFAAIVDLVVNPATGQLGAVGTFHGTLTLRAAGTGPALSYTSPTEPQNGAFVAGLAPAGAAQWAQPLASTGMTQNGTTGRFFNKLSAVAPVGAGFAVAGGYLGAGTLAGAALPGSAASDNITAVLARFDGQGQLQWTQAVSGDGTAESGAVATALAADAAGQLHVAGFFIGHLAADGGGQTSAGGADVLLLRFTDQGRLLGTQRDGSFGNEYPTALALDPSGQPRVAGYFRGTSSFGGTVLASGPRENGFVARLGRTPLGTRAASAPQAALQVFPNPSAGLETLQVHLLPSAAPTTLRLLNALGQQVHSQAVPARAAGAALPVAGLAPGRYVLQAVSAEGVATRGVLVN